MIKHLIINNIIFTVIVFKSYYFLSTSQVSAKKFLYPISEGINSKLKDLRSLKKRV